MATFVKHTHKSGKVTWKCKARRKGFRTRTQTFDSKAEAQVWARAIESAMDSGEHSTNRKAEQTTFADILEKYRDEVSPTHRGHKNEVERINAFLRHPVSHNTMKKERLLAELLFQMGTVLKFDIPALDMFKGGYVPKGWEHKENRSNEMLEYFHKLSEGDGSFPISLKGVTQPNPPQPPVQPPQ